MGLGSSTIPGFDMAERLRGWFDKLIGSNKVSVITEFRDNIDAGLSWIVQRWKGVSRHTHSHTV